MEGIDGDFDRALNAALGFAPHATPADRAMAVSFLAPFKTLSCALQLLQSSIDEKRLWFAVSTLEELVRSPLELDLQQLVTFLWTAVLEPHASMPSYVTSKLRVVLVYVVLRQDALLEFLSKLRDTIATPIAGQTYHLQGLELLAVVCEEVCSNQDDSRSFFPTLTKDRVRQKTQFQTQLDALTILTVGILKEISKPTTQLAAINFLDAVATTSLRILGYLYTFELPPYTTPTVLQETIEILFILAGNRAHVHDTNRFPMDASSQAACDTLIVFVLKKWAHQVTDVVVEHVLSGLLHLLENFNQVTSMTAMNEPYLDKVSELTESFLTTHLRRLEKHMNGLTTLLASVLVLTQHQPHVSGLFHCLTVWEIFVTHVEEAEAQGFSHPEMLRSYETGLVGVMQHLVDRVMYATNEAQLEELDDEPQQNEDTCAAGAYTGIDLNGENETLQVIRTGALQDQSQESVEMSDLKAFVFECFSLIRRIAQLPFCAMPLVEKMLPIVQNASTQFMQIHLSPVLTGAAKNKETFAVRDLTVACALLSCVSAQHYSASNALSDKMAGWEILRMFIQLAEYIVGRRLHTRGPAFVELECEVLACVRLCTSCIPYVLQSGAVHEVLNIMECVLQVILQALDTSIVPSPQAVMQASLHLLANVGAIIPYNLHASIPGMIQLRSNLQQFSLHLPPLIQANLYKAMSNAILQQSSSGNDAEWISAYDTLVAPVMTSFVESSVAIQHNEQRIVSNSLLSQLTRDISICRALATAVRLKNKSMKMTFATHVMPVMSSALTLARLYLTYLYQNIQVPKAHVNTAVNATNELVGLYIDVLNSIRKEMPTELIHHIITTFVELFQHAPLTAALESLGSSGTGVLCGFLKLLRILIEESTSTFANLLQSILDLCFGPLHETIFAHKHYDTVVPFFISLMEQILEKHYRFFVVSQMTFDERGHRQRTFASDQANQYFMSILQAVGTIFQQENLPPHLCKQIIQLLQRIHKTHQLFDFRAFQDQVRQPYMHTLLKLLCSGHVNLLREELGSLLHAIASVDFQSFYHVALPQFIQECFPGLNAERVLSSWSGQTDEPTFLKELNYFLNDIRVLQLTISKTMEESPIDGEKVNSGVRFLSHPDVQATPLSERLAFLENKGLSRAEINAAVEKHHQTNVELAKKEATPAPSASLWSILFPLAGTTAVLGFLWKFMQYDESQKLEEEVALAAEYTRPMSNETALVQAIQAQTAEMMKLMSVMQLESQERRELVSKQSNTNQSITELRSELASLKATINELKAQGNVKSPKVTMKLPPINTSKEDVVKDATEDAQVEFKKKAQAMLDALKQVELENDCDTVKQAASILIMYTKNLVEQPDVPRYRRIATGNANFKQKIEPLKHHLALLTSIGFQKVGMSMEWKWHSTPSYTTNLTILKAAIHAFESAVANNGEVLSIAAESYLNSNAPTVLLNSPKAEAQVEEVKTPDLDSFLMKLKQPKEPVADESASEPSYPKSFTEVMKMVQNGEEVPGIRKIEDKLSEESQAKLDTPVEELPAKKPWSK